MSEKTKILIVDDNPANLKALKVILRKIDAELISARSGEEALELLLDSDDYALILMDVQMPGLDGFETVELIQKDRKTKEIPVIFLSAIFTEEEFLVKGIDKGAVDFLTKPLNSELLVSKVKKQLEIHNSSKQLRLDNNKLESTVVERTKELEIALQQLEEQKKIISQSLEKELFLNELKSQFIKNIAHEYKTPITGIMSSVEVLTTYYDKITEQDILKLGNKIKDSTLKMSSLIDGILQFNEMDNLKANKSMNDIIIPSNEIIQKLQSQFINKKIIFNSNLEKSNHNIVIQFYREILRNLVSNALKFSHDESSIYVDLEDTQDGIILTVKNNGFQIPDDEREYIYELFYRGKKHIGLIDGNGIGLTIASKCCELANYKISFESGENKTIFTVEFTETQ